MRSALVVGAAGFLGRHLIDALLAEEWAVTGAGRGDPPPGWAHDWVACDLRSDESVAGAVSSLTPDAIFQVAGAALDDLEALFAVHVAGSQRLVEAVRGAGIAARVITTGSAAEYGNAEPELMPVTESAPLRPLSLYGVAKVAQSLLAQRPGVPAIVARLFNMTGPGEPRSLVGGAFASQIAELERDGRDGTIDVGDLRAERDFIDVRDAARALAALAAHGELREVYNVCSGIPTAISDVFQLLAEQSTVKVEARYDAARAARVNVPRMVGSAAKLQAATGWTPRIPLPETLSDLLATYRNQVAGLNS